METLKKIMLTIGVSIALPLLSSTSISAMGASFGNSTSFPPLPEVQHVTPTPPQGNIDSLLRYFDHTTQLLKDNVTGLSEAQLQFSPGDGKWSISQCLEHIILSEKMLFEMAKKELAKPAQPERKAEVKVTDENLINMMTDRSQKFQAPKELQPAGQYKNSTVAINDLIAARQPVLVYIQNANLDDLRNHISEYPTGIVDGYQNLLFIAAHCARHTKQIEEVKADPNFPKK
ncbi:DinB family protein [Sphingobacterium sp. SYP-B4668]|uniref:DinB family protein n=1 Tax=Sphingobacterium sp. SYP-B4668 TaxID=2996035 RepID=UPI0022DE6CBE|nr:DinB family protein [Sphingobacterium sp. SYP-B4668]